MKLSFIIPSWGDEEKVRLLLPRLSASHEVIVAEASADDYSMPAATVLRCDAPSRGAQMNLGAGKASGDVLVFLHADAELEPPHVAAIKTAMANDDIAGGAFYRKFDERHPHLHCLEPVARFLTRHGGTLFGDQTVFVRRAIFEKLGGFAEIPLMEDVEFSRRLRAAGRIAVLDPPIRTSPRHHLEHGAWRTTIRNGLFLLLFKLGVSAERLHASYYARRRQPNAPSPQPAIRHEEVGCTR